MRRLIRIEEIRFPRRTVRRRILMFMTAEHRKEQTPDHYFDVSVARGRQLKKATQLFFQVYK